VPLTVGQEWSGWAAQLDTAAARVEAAQGELDWYNNRRLHSQLNLNRPGESGDFLV
jgi:transposase InsO family protein